jgi:hypothetical protein
MRAKKPTMPTAMPSSTTAALKNAPESDSSWLWSTYAGWEAMSCLLAQLSVLAEPRATALVRRPRQPAHSLAENYGLSIGEPADAAHVPGGQDWIAQRTVHE